MLSARSNADARRGSFLLAALAAQVLAQAQESQKQEFEKSKAAPQERVVVTGTHIRGVPPASPEIVLTDADIANSGAMTPSSGTSETPSVPRLEEIIVTGTRIPLPPQQGAQEVKVYTRAQIDRSGGATLSEFLNTLPDVSVSITENGFQTLSGTTTVQLHGLPVGTTLILLNGRRVGTSGAAQAYGLTYFDLNSVPLAAIDRIEVIAQGSSAIYGSDALAGVVNVILKSGFAGLEASGKYGFAADNHEQNAEIAWGQRGERGSFAVIGSYLFRTELPGYDRLLPNDNNYTAYGGENRDFFMCPDQANVYSLNGGNLPGVPSPYAAVPKGYTSAPSLQEFIPTAGSLNRCSVFRYASQIQGTERAGALFEGSYAIAETTELYSQLLFSHTLQFGRITPPILFGAPGFQLYTVGAANPFNPFGQAVGVSDTLSDLGREREDLRTNYGNAVLGVKGQLGQSWTWDTGISDSEDRTRYTQTDLDQIALRAALNSPDPSSALDLFEAAPPASGQLLQSLLKQDRWDFLGRATLADVILRGPIASLPGGALQLAVGGEYEWDTLSQDQFYGAALHTSFHRKSYAVFSEVRLPLLKPFANSATGERLAVTLAGRFDHYDDFGSKATPQFGGEWRPFESLLLRGSYSQAFRAPDLTALHMATTTSNGAITDPLRGNAPEIVSVTVGGNPALRPQKGISRTLGLLYSNHALGNLTVSVTHWSIDTLDGIRQLPVQTVVNNADLFPGAVTRASSCQGSPPCPITAVTATYLNFGSLRVAGLDYQLKVQQDSSIGSFTPSIDATQTYRYRASLTPGSATIDAMSVAQDTGNWAPRWKGTLALDWRLAGWDATLIGRYVGRYQDYDSSRTIGNFWLVDANVLYTMGRALAPASRYWQGLYVRLGAVNLLNRAPQFSNFEFDIVGYDPSQADIRGRFLYSQVGVRW